MLEAAPDNPIAIEIFDYACHILKSCGFKHLKTAYNTNSCYYALDGCEGVFRISFHKCSNAEYRFAKHQPIWAKFTISPATNTSPNKMWSHTEQMIAKGIGFYLMKKNGLKLDDGTIKCTTP